MDEVSFGCNKYRCEMGGSMVLIASGKSIHYFFLTRTVVVFGVLQDHKSVDKTVQFFYTWKEQSWAVREFF